MRFAKAVVRSRVVILLLAVDIVTQFTIIIFSYTIAHDHLTVFSEGIISCWE